MEECPDIDEDIVPGDSRLVISNMKSTYNICATLNKQKRECIELHNKKAKQAE